MQNLTEDISLQTDLRTSYLMNLGPGLSWRVEGTRDTHAFLTVLANLLKIHPGRNGTLPKIVLGANPTGFGDFNLAERNTFEEWVFTDFIDAKIWSHPAIDDLFCEFTCDEDSNALFRLWSLISHIVQTRAIHIGGLPIHAALIEKEGHCIALLGESGRGKTTCCRRIQSPWLALSDDHALLLPSAGKSIEAMPFPTWGDLQSNDRMTLPRMNHRVPLSAIFFLEHSQIDDVVPIGQGEATLRINQSVSQIFGGNIHILETDKPYVTRRLIFDNSCNISKAVKAYILRVTLTGRFWDRISEVL